MKCRRIRKLLTAYTDGELPEENRRTVSEHLVECERCREYAARLRKVLDWAALWRDRQTSPDFLSRLKARARAAEEPRAERVRLFVPRARTVLAGLATACLVFLLGYLAGVNFSGEKYLSQGAPSVAKGGALAGKPTAPSDAERLIVGVQRIKMIFGSKLSQNAYAQLNEVQLALAKGDETVVQELQQAEDFVRHKNFAQARRLLDQIERDYPEHALAPYARMTKIFTTPRPGYGWELLNNFYASLLRETVIDPREFYSQLAGFQTEVTEYGWQKIVESADRLNPLNVLDYLENRLAGGSETL